MSEIPFWTLPKCHWMFTDITTAQGESDMKKNVRDIQTGNPKLICCKFSIRWNGKEFLVFEDLSFLNS